jgi:transposase-like protein
VTCPFCSSAEVERVAQWGGQIITAQWRCNACSSYFEAVREDFEDPLGGLAAAQRSLAERLE